MIRIFTTGFYRQNFFLEQSFNICTELFIKNMLKNKYFLNVLFSITNRDLEAFTRGIMQRDCKYPLSKVEWLKHSNERWESPTYINKICHSIATRAKPWVMLLKRLEYINVLFIFHSLKSQILFQQMYRKLVLCFNM